MAKGKVMVDQIPLILIDESEQGGNVSFFPTVVQEAKSDYQTPSDETHPEGRDDRTQFNLKALMLLNDLDKKKRLPTPKEQAILSQYTGWMGLDKELAINKDTIPEKQCKQVEKSPKSVFATPVWIVQTVYKVLHSMGFENGSILIHGCGTGSFIGHMPSIMRNRSKVTAGAVDPITACLLSELYPSITVLDESQEWPESLYDIAVGHIPFDQTLDKQLDYKGRSEKLKAYEFTIKKSLIGLRSGGIFVALVPQKYNDTPSEYRSIYEMTLNSHLEHLLSLRLNSEAFAPEYGEYDIMFFRKRPGKKMGLRNNWGQTRETKYPVFMRPNQNSRVKVGLEFVLHPQYIIGTPYIKSTTNGPRLWIEQATDKGKAIVDAVEYANIKRAYQPIAVDKKTEGAEMFPADPKVKNYSMIVIYGDVYQRVDSVMVHQNLSPVRLKRAIGMIAIRDCAKELIQAQLENCTDVELETKQYRLNQLYDSFVKDFGKLCNQANTVIMREDAEYSVLASLEYIDDNDAIQKADIFHKRTVRVRKNITHCDTVEEGFEVCLDQLGYVDVGHIAQLCDINPSEVADRAAGKLFYKNPQPTDKTDAWIPRDMYLSGNVLKKLRIAMDAAETDPALAINVKALEDAKPLPIPSQDIIVQMGAPWIPGTIIARFIHQVILDGRPGCSEESFSIENDEKGKWSIIPNLVFSPMDAAIHSEYGTEEKSAFWLIEKIMNSQSIKGYSSDGKGESKPDDNKTMALTEKADKIKRAFNSWFFEDPLREAEMTMLYNEKHNALVVPKYDGSHLTFPGISSAIVPKKHQYDAVCRVMRENGALIAHKVGYGKTAIMICAGMELKRLGRINKPVYVVPNPLVSQWGGEFARLYPSANLLIAHPEDLHKARKERFLRRIATGDYDAVIMASSSFDNIPPPYELVKTSTQKRKRMIDKFKKNNSGPKAVHGFKHSAKGMKNALAKIDKFADDDLARIYKRTLEEPYTLDQLGLDYLVVDESHRYKNLRVESIRGSLKGISIGKTSKCQDMLYKCRYFNELHDGKGGFIFASGTPIDNSIVELYVLQRYFQEELLIELGIFTLDDWLNLYGIVSEDWELPVEGLQENGKGFQMVERVSSFINVPELMAMVLQFMDIKMGGIDFELPNTIRETISTPMYDALRSYLDTLVERAQIIRAGGWHRGFSDNMLSITTDARMASLDLNLVLPGSPDFRQNKINRCAKKVAEFYHRYSMDRKTQVVFCDTSTPNNSGYNVYKALKEKLIENKVNANEIAFAHEFKTPKKLTELKMKMQAGKIRVLIGSSDTVGTGFNIQKKLIALHHLDIPWTPKNIEQREGRIERNGNENDTVYIFQYVTEGSFDSYLWQIIETKARMTAQIMRGDYTKRTVEDSDVKVLNYAEIKAIATGNNSFLERTKVEGRIMQLETYHREYESRQTTLKQNIYIKLPSQIAKLETAIPQIEEDIRTVSAYCNSAVVEISGTAYEGDEALDKAAELMDNAQRKQNGDVLGTYNGLKMIWVEQEMFTLTTERYLKLQGKHSYSSPRLRGWHGKYLFAVCNDIIKEMSKELESCRAQLLSAQNAYKAAKSQLNEPFAYEVELEMLYIERECISVDIANFTPKCA